MFSVLENPQKFNQINYETSSKNLKVRNRTARISASMSCEQKPVGSTCFLQEMCCQKLSHEDNPISLCRKTQQFSTRNCNICKESCVFTENFTTQSGNELIL